MLIVNVNRWEFLNQRKFKFSKVPNIIQVFFFFSQRMRAINPSKILKKFYYCSFPFIYFFKYGGPLIFRVLFFTEIPQKHGVEVDIKMYSLLVFLIEKKYQQKMEEFTLIRSHDTG